ncbi:Uncharacterised protein [Mycobacteroides abscessus subsp. abscessus]|nr:Uncharacterised protein [Mycobacteroides abscessus subsp. abscessus]
MLLLATHLCPVTVIALTSSETTAKNTLPVSSQKCTIAGREGAGVPQDPDVKVPWITNVQISP